VLMVLCVEVEKINFIFVNEHGVGERRQIVLKLWAISLSLIKNGILLRW
jgi:hypothetical protein